MKKILTLLISLFSLNSFSQTWSAMGDGFNDVVNCLAFYNGDLYAGGAFTQSGDSTVNHIARWDGARWVEVGGGMNDVVNEIIVFQDELYAVGYFTIAGGDSALKIARWNGTEWSSVGGGITTTDWVGAMEVFDSCLYVGGLIDYAGTVPVSNLARWNGSNWSAVENGVSCFNPSFCAGVQALRAHNGKLYVGGFFQFAGSTYARSIVAWNGSYWETLDVGINGQVAALGTYNGFLYAGGNFTTAGSDNLPAQRLVLWNDIGWESVGDGVDKFVSRFTTYKGELIFGGGFSKSGNYPMKFIGNYNGNTFRSLGTGLDTTVYAMVSDSSFLYVGGMFTMAGGAPANRIAKWEEAVSVKESNQLPVNVFPNPASDLVTIITGIDEEVEAVLYDLLGNVILSQSGRGQIRLDVSELNAGTFCLKVQGKSGTRNSKLIVLD